MKQNNKYKFYSRLLKTLICDMVEIINKRQKTNINIAHNKVIISYKLKAVKVRRVDDKFAELMTISLS